MSKNDITVKIFGGNSSIVPLVDLKSIFKEYNLYIPVYQRPYAWSKQNFEDLRETINRSFELNNQEEKHLDCFLGSVILCKKGEDHKDKYLIIDGQQRLTSFLIILRFIYGELGKEISHIEDRLEEITSEGSVAKSQFNTYDFLNENKKDLIEREKEIKSLIDNTKIERVFDASGSQTESTLLNYINKGEEPKDDDNFKDIKREINEWEELAENKMKYLDFILNNIKMCVLFIDSDSKQSESFSVDMFNTLNATGVPLTAFEILKSNLYPKGKEFTERIEKIEKNIENKYRKNRKHITRDTGLYILFLAVYRGYKGKISDKQFTEQNHYIKELFADANKNQIEGIVSDIEKIDSFYSDYWNSNSLDMKDKVTVFCFEFLRKIKHTRVIPTLLHFQKDLNDCIKLCTSFSVLWRACHDGSTSGIDKIYRKACEDIVENKITNVKQLKEYFISQFKANGNFLNYFTQTMVTSKVVKNKSISRFLLLASEVPFNKMSMKDLNKISLKEALSIFEAPVTHQALGNLYSTEKPNSIKTKEDIEKRTIRLTKNILKNLDFI